MLKPDKPDFLDLDKDGNKTEPMKEAAKQAKERDGMAHGGEPLPNEAVCITSAFIFSFLALSICGLHPSASNMFVFFI